MKRRIDKLGRHFEHLDYAIFQCQFKDQIASAIPKIGEILEQNKWAETQFKEVFFYRKKYGEKKGENNWFLSPRDEIQMNKLIAGKARNPWKPDKYKPHALLLKMGMDNQKPGFR